MDRCMDGWMDQKTYVLRDGFTSQSDLEAELHYGKGRALADGCGPLRRQRPELHILRTDGLPLHKRISLDRSCSLFC